MTYAVLEAKLAFPLSSLDTPSVEYTRMLIVMPYRSADKVPQVERSFESINCQLLGLTNNQYLSTYELTETDKRTRSKDYLGGFELLDKEMRMYVVEGIAGEGKSMDLFYRANEREHPNDKRFKMLYNPNVRF